MKLTHAFWLLIAILALVQPLRVKAHDHDHPELDSWYKSLHSGLGVCCDGSDAFSIADPDWDTTADPEFPYKVFLRGDEWGNKWYMIPKVAVVEVPNKAGVAKVWPVKWLQSSGNNHIEIRCFIPGTFS